jgi:hypothetical protein
MKMPYWTALTKLDWARLLIRRAPDGVMQASGLLHDVIRIAVQRGYGELERGADELVATLATA